MNQGLYYAIGGTNYDTEESLEIDLDIKKEINKANPKVLYIGAAYNDDKNQIEKFKKYYQKLGFEVDVLYSYQIELKEEEILDKIIYSDLIYLGGGMVSLLMEFALKYDLQKYLKFAINNGKIVAGVSAGAIILFQYGYGDKEAYYNNLESRNHKVVSGLGIYNGVFCPHYQLKGLESFHDEIKNYKCNGYALENGAALKICNNNFTIIKNKNSNAFMFDYSLNHQLCYLKSNKNYPINTLIRRD